MVSRVLHSVRDSWMLITSKFSSSPEAAMAESLSLGFSTGRNSNSSFTLQDSSIHLVYSLSSQTTLALSGVSTRMTAGSEPVQMGSTPGSLRPPSSAKPSTQKAHSMISASSNAIFFIG